VRGSAEAVKSSLERLGTSEVKVKVIHAATGPVSDSDVMLAEASNGIIIAFTRIDPSKKRSDVSGVETGRMRSFTRCSRMEKALQGMPICLPDGHRRTCRYGSCSSRADSAGSQGVCHQLRRGSNVRVLRNNRVPRTRRGRNLR
jgi:translation initiation factor IF-2